MLKQSIKILYHKGCLFERIPLIIPLLIIMKSECAYPRMWRKNFYMSDNTVIPRLYPHFGNRDFSEVGYFWGI